MAYRVVFVIQKFAGLRGGAERVIVDIARFLAEQGGMDVRIVSFEPGTGSPAYDLAGITHQNLFSFQRRYPVRAYGRQARSGYRKRRHLEKLLRHVPNVTWVQHLKWALTHGLFAKALKKHLDQASVDIVIAFLPPAIAATGWALRSMAPADQPAFIASTHNLPEADFADGSARWDQNPLYRQRARYALTRAQAITVLNSDFVNGFDAAQHLRVAVIPNLVRRLSPLRNSPVRRTPTILGVGRFTTVKRFDLLIKAFSLIASKYPDWDLTLLGEGPERSALESLVAFLGLERRVHLPGTTAGIADAYDRASILCHPALFEGFGLAVAEAMAHGLPAVAFETCSGVNMLIDTERNGILVQDEKDPVGSLSDALDRLVRDPDLRNALGAEARSITARFDADVIGRKWVSLIEQTVETRCRAAEER